ncbi:MAG TPA: hypothetical protein VLG11_04650 [Candidatus Saccharimonadales bacterium]|nr:hypothetical protein [Candidatus Saccharimonadales bacterium]
MSNFEASVCFLASNNVGEQVPGHPAPVEKWRFDRMIPERDDLQRRLAERGIGTSIGLVYEWPDDNEPVIACADNPIFQRDGAGRDLVTQDTIFYLKPVEELGGAVVDRYSERVNKPKFGLTDKVINPYTVQQMGYDKWWVHTEGTTPSDDHVTTIPTFQLQDNDTAVREWGDVPVIVKPRAGGEGKGMYGFQTPAELNTWLNRQYASLGAAAYRRFLNYYIIQPEVDFTKPLPLEPFSPKDAAQFHARNDNKTPKEIGLYTFYHAPSDTFTCFPVPRRNMRRQITDAIRPEWFFADPDYLTNELAPSAAADMQLVAKKSGALGIYGRVDYGYGQLPGQVEPQIYKIEANLRNPYLMSTARHAVVGGIVRDMYTDLLADLARTPSQQPV